MKNKEPPIATSEVKEPQEFSEFLTCDNGKEDSPFATLSEQIEALPVNAVEKPDWLNPFRDEQFPRPEIIKVLEPVQLICIGGWQHIEDARAAGATNIIARVQVVGETNPCELLLLKLELHHKPPGGKPRYAEIIGSTHDVFEELMRTRDDLKAYAHGGARKRQNIDGSREDNVRTVIANRLSYKKQTINNHLNFAEHIDDDVLGKLADDDAPKRFFEDAQKFKRNKINILKEENILPEEITRIVSDYILELFAEYKTKGNSLRDYQAPYGAENSSPEAGSDGATTPQSADTPELEGPLEMKYWQGSDGEGAQPTTLTLEDQRKKWAEIKDAGDAYFGQEHPSAGSEEMLKNAARELVVLASICGALSEGGAHA